MNENKTLRAVWLPLWMWQQVDAIAESHQDDWSKALEEILRVSPVIDIPPSPRPPAAVPVSEQ